MKSTGLEKRAVGVKQRYIPTPDSFLCLLSRSWLTDSLATKLPGQCYRRISRSPCRSRRSSDLRYCPRKDQIWGYGSHLRQVRPIFYSLGLGRARARVLEADLFRSSVVERVLLDAWSEMREKDSEASFSVVVVDSRPLNEGKCNAIFLQHTTITSSQLQTCHTPPLTYYLDFFLRPASHSLPPGLRSESLASH